MFKKILNAGNYPTRINLAILILRITIGAFILTHGLQKMALLFGSEPVQFADPIGVGQYTTLVLAVFTEVVCALLLIVGFGTRIAALLLVITMAVAVLIVHQGDEFKNMELALVYFSAFLAISFSGGGRFSIDSLLFKRSLKFQ